MRRALILGVVALLVGCEESFGDAKLETAVDAGDSGNGTDGSDGADDGTEAPVDADGDGYTDDVDCWDDPEGPTPGISGADIYPGAEDVWYDGVDQDCGGDDDCDADGDGHPFAPGPGTEASPFPSGTDMADALAACGLSEADIQDCNDSDPTVAPDPDIEEVFYNYKDDNCIVSPGDQDGDKDGDGHWDAGYDFDAADDTVQPSIPSEELRADCWDDPDARPGAFETATVFAFDPAQPDLSDPSTLSVVFDADGDGKTDELDAADVFPGAFDRPYDGVDQDCAGDAPEADFDWDGDGFASLYQYGDNGGTWVARGDDCLDCSDDCADAEPGSELEAACSVVCDNDAWVVVSGAEPGLTNLGELDSVDVNPAATETWLDGTDADCSRTSDYDADGDFYGDRRYELETGDLWDTIELGRPGYYSGMRLNGGGDCNDNDADFNPGPDGQARDAWYDGLDHDCADNDDFDADGDGDRSDAFAPAATTQGQDAAGAIIVAVAAAANPNTDCVDDPALSSALFYGVFASDTWYDGLDHDCQGDDDFDADGDGFRDDQYAPQATVQGTVTVVGTTENPNTDCVDDPLEASNATSFHPDATEVWYDGEDWDCAGDDDYDADADGYRSEDETPAATTQGVETVVPLGAAASTDCVDDPDEASDAASYYPAATDTWYDGKDHDCAGDDDYDADGDGDRSDAYIGAATVQGASTVVAASTNPNTDCVDSDSDYVGTPPAADAWYDGEDHDCAGNDDYDADGDGYRSEDYAAAATAQSGTIVVGAGANPNTDCVDTDSSYAPGASDSWYDGLDHDCGGDDDYDADGDGDRSDAYAASATVQDGTLVVAAGANPNTDCVDTSTAYGSFATDLWYDGEDHDCMEDDDYDADGDGERSDDYAAAATLQAATVVVAASANPNTDCVDFDAAYNQAATDVWYDGEDTNCGYDDDYDADGDGYRSDLYPAAATTQRSLIVVASGANPNTDCVDTDATYSPGAVEVWYDSFDTDCGGDDDYDADGDGDRSDAYAPAATVQGTTTVVAAGANPNTDCDDSDTNSYQSAPDAWYDGEDRDCMGDDDFDADGDGDRSDDYAAASTRQGSTVVVAASANPNTDCVDTDTAYYAGAVDIWYDGEDWDCAGDDDYDQDGDGDRSDAYAAAHTWQGSTVVVASGASPNTDCVDTSTNYYSGATDTWYDGLDHDCQGDDDYDADGDGARSDAYAPAATLQDSVTVVASGANPNNDCDDADAAYIIDTYYADADADGYGNAAVTDEACGVAPSGYVSDNTDCDDADVAIYPGASETADGVDEDCNGSIDDNGVITTGSDYLKITEFIPDPSGLDSQKEWVEVTNPNAFTVVMEEDLWWIGQTGTSPYNIMGPITLASGESVVFGRSTNTGVNGNVTVEESYGSKLNLIHTGSGSSDIYLEYDDPTLLTTVEVDVVDYDFVGDWSALLSTGYSVELDYDTGAGAYAADNNDSANWCLATSQWDGADYGTPGETNDGCP